MMKKILSVSFVFSLITVFSGCCKKHQDAISVSPAVVKNNAGPPVYIYKTRADYSKYVPIVLSADKKSIVSYPAPGDIYFKGELSYPTPLNKGYFLDNRGISKDAAFLKITYEEYSRLSKAPSTEELMSKIFDKDPFTELYYCGSRYDYKDLVAELNQLIDKKDFSKFRSEK